MVRMKAMAWIGVILIGIGGAAATGLADRASLQARQCNGWECAAAIIPTFTGGGILFAVSRKHRRQQSNTKLADSESLL
jgi:hypothetical protein